MQISHLGACTGQLIPPATHTHYIPFHEIINKIIAVSVSCMEVPFSFLPPFGKQGTEEFSKLGGRLRGSTLQSKFLHHLWVGFLPYVLLGSSLLWDELYGLMNRPWMFLVLKEPVCIAFNPGQMVMCFWKGRKERWCHSQPGTAGGVMVKLRNYQVISSWDGFQFNAKKDIIS